MFYIFLDIFTSYYINDYETSFLPYSCISWKLHTFLALCISAYKCMSFVKFYLFRNFLSQPLKKTLVGVEELTLESQPCVLWNRWEAMTTYQGDSYSNLLRKTYRHMRPNTDVNLLLMRIFPLSYLVKTTIKVK